VAISAHHAPLGMFVRRQVIPLHRDVDRNADVASVTGLDLLLQQVSRKVRMPPLAKRGGIEIDPAVVAAGKTGYRVDPGPLERGGELLRIEVRADTGNMLAGVEIEMDLSKA
jgi:hypothetical protein